MARLITGEKEPVGYAEDIAKGTVGGLGRGVTGLIGLPGTVGSLMRAGAEKVGVPSEYIDRAASVAKYTPFGALTLPDAGQVQGAVEGVTGEFYKPKTIPGQFASTIAEYAPGALAGGPATSVGRAIAARTLNTVAPAITSETAGQFTKDTPYEPYARFAGGVVGGFAGAKAITPIGPASPAYQRDVATLEKAGIPLTAGQRTGSKPLQWTESNAVDMPVVSGQATRLRDAPLAALDRAVTERIYDPKVLAVAPHNVPPGVHLPDPRVAAAGPKTLSDNYKQLTQSPFVSTPQLQNRMTRAQTAYENLILPSDRAATVANTRNDIVNRLVAGQGVMSGRQYQSIRSQIGDKIRANPNSEEVTALREYKKALDDAYMAGLSPADAAALAQNNRRYALMKQIDPAVAAAGEHLSPAKLAQTVKSRRGAQYAARSGDLDELAAAAGNVMKPLPQSGTAPRMAAQLGGGGLLGTAIGGTIGGPVGAAVGAGIGAATPVIPSLLATSRPGQLYLGNRALPQNPRDILAQVLAEQAISQPSGVKRNQAERDAYRKLQRVYVNAP